MAAADKVLLLPLIYLSKHHWMDGNKRVQAFPFFGAERRGAPIRAFARVSEDQIHLQSEIYTPDIVIVLDESIMGLVDILKGLKKIRKNGTIN